MISNFFWQMNKLAIRLSWLRPDSVDIGLFSSFKKIISFLQLFLPNEQIGDQAELAEV